MKRKIAIFLLCLLLCGCTAVPDAAQVETRTPETQTESQTERITTQPVKAPSEAAQVQASQQAIMTQAPTEAQTSTSPPVPTKPPTPTEKTESTQASSTLPSTAEPTESAPTESVPATELTEAETPTEPPTEPPFDIDAWVSFAREYAVSLGLVLDSAATSCWDNPILASAQSRYLERDLKGVLEDYASAPDISQVWIWSELRPDGRYDIYIGYA